ncbi:hypothetical protein V8E53_002344 [Lactarius tabidus]
MSSREQPSRLSFTNTRGRGGRLRPDHGNRFYFQGSRGRGGGSAAARFAPDGPPEPDLKEGLDATKIIDTILAPARPKAPKDFPIDNVKYVASYNWVDAEKPTMIVPGSPAIWTERAVPFTLQPDDNFIYVDRNTAQLSQYPLLPLFAAADAIHSQEATPPVDWPTVDAITDRNGLRKLLRWLNPSPGRAVRDFRIDVQLLGAKTLVLSRWESPTREIHTGRSFGHAFETAMTCVAPDCPSSGHQRVITYDMFGMKMIVRFGVDAYLPSPDLTAATTTNDDSDLADALSNVNIQQSPISTSASTTSQAIDIVHAGKQVPQDALVELISRSKYYLDQLDWNELYPQMALSQTPMLRLGVHERGEFTELREWQLGGPGAQVDAGVRRRSGTLKGADVLDLSVQRQETAVQVMRLAKVLEDVQKIAIARGPGPAGSFSLVCEDGKLRVYALKKVGDGDGDGKSLSESCLPPEVVARFETRPTQIEA